MMRCVNRIFFIILSTLLDTIFNYKKDEKRNK